MGREIPALSAEQEEFQPLEQADERYMQRIQSGKGPRLVVPATEAEMLRVAANQPCHTCDHFNLPRGQELIVKERFWERLKREEKWEHFDQWIHRRDTFGLCQMYSSEDEGGRLVDGMAPGFARAADFDSSLLGTSEGDAKVKCPYWKSKWGSRQKRTKY